MKFQTILAVSDTYDRSLTTFTKEALKKLAMEDPINLYYNEINGRGYLIETKIIEVSDKDYWKNIKQTWGNQVNVIDISDKLEEIKR